MPSFRPIIELWGRRSNLAEDLKIPRITVQQWWLRDSIPAEYFGDVVAAAQKRGIRSVTERALLDLLYARRHVPATEDTLAPRDGSEVGAS